MYRVLLPVDANEARARAQVDAVLDLPGETDEVSVDVAYVHERASAPSAEWSPGGFAETYEEAMSESPREDRTLPKSVERAVELLDEAGVESAVLELSGDPAEAILEIAAERGSDAIVIGARRQSPVGKVLFGSVAQAVILDSERPVTVVPE